MFSPKSQKIKPKKILFMAAVGSHNLGDELILKGEVGYIQEQYGENVEITVCTYDPTSSIIPAEQVSFVSYFPNDIRQKPLRNIGYFFHNIWLIIRADLLIIGGGGIIFDNEPGVSFRWLFAQWLWRTRIARIAHTDILFWGIGLEVTEPVHQLQLRRLFEPGDRIFVRDPRSKGLLDTIGVASVEAPDIVFLYTPSSELQLRSPTKIVGLSMRGGFLRENESIVPFIYDTLITQGYQPVFLLFSTDGEAEQNDRIFIQRIMSGRVYEITESIGHTLDIYPCLYAVIGMRLHAGILACVHEIPYIPISYGPKTAELINMLHINHLALGAKDLNGEGFLDRWNILTRDYEKEKTNMHSSHIRLRDSLIEKLQNL